MIANQYIEYTLLITVSLAIAWVISFSLRQFIDFIIKKKLYADPTKFIFLKNSISFIIFSITILWIVTKIPYLKSLGNALFASAGIFAAIIGFASQKAFSNIIGGIFILIFKPFRVGDAIEVSNTHKGIIEEITLRHTVIKDYEFRRIIIPNSIMGEETIINSSITDKKIRKHIDIGIDYDANIDLAESIIQQEIEKHPYYIDGRTTKEKNKNLPTIPIKVISLGDSSIILRAFVWTKDFDDSVELERDSLKNIKIAFDKHGINIPFPHRTIVLKNPSKNKSYETKE